MSEKRFVTVSRKWHNPQIEITVSNEEISLKMSLNDFVEALKTEVGSVTWIVKKSTFDQTIEAAIERVLTGVKAESAKAMAK